MPYEWRSTDTENGQTLTLWPHCSLAPVGFVWFIGLTAALMALPVLATIGTAVLWGVLPFVLTAIAAIWFALRTSWRKGEISETLTLTPDRAELIRADRTGTRRWVANPYWVRVNLHETGGPVPNYLTLTGGDREVEIGAFLAEDERLRLRTEINQRMIDLRNT